MATNTANLNIANIQGDIIPGLHKRVEAFVFLSLKKDPESITKFRKILKSRILPQITTVEDVTDTDLKIKEARNKDPNIILPITELNISFSASGLIKLGIPADQLPGKGNGGISAFQANQRADAIRNLGDPLDAQTQSLRTWSADYLKGSIDVLIIVTAPFNQLLNHKLDELEHELRGLLTHSFVRRGNVRPGSEAGHEHFGYLDGLSAPKIKGFNDDEGGEKVGVVGPEVVLTGQTIDKNSPDYWKRDGSFIVFRELQQLVPEFDKFVVDLGKQVGKEPGLIGARIVGRWKSGAPVVIASEKDDPSLARSQDFDYSDDFLQVKCPYAAHVRKTNPRAGMQGVDVNTNILPHLIIRAGIPYGPELSQEEKKSKRTIEERGLLFVCYQSSIEAGFQRVQQHWSNDVNFPPNNPAKVTPGFDLIVGINNQSKPRIAQNIFPKGQSGSTDSNNVVTAMSDFVLPKGGEYLFVPSIDAIKHKLGL